MRSSPGSHFKGRIRSSSSTNAEWAFRLNRLVLLYKTNLLAALNGHLVTRKKRKMWQKNSSQFRHRYFLLSPPPSSPLSSPLSSPVKLLHHSRQLSLSNANLTWLKKTIFCQQTAIQFLCYGQTRHLFFLKRQIL